MDIIVSREGSEGSEGSPLARHDAWSRKAMGRATGDDVGGDAVRVLAIQANGRLTSAPPSCRQWEGAPPKTRP